MADLEGVIRPFQRPDSLATRRIIASNEKVDVQPAIISWGKAGTIAGAHQIEAIDPSGVSFTVNPDEQYTEKAGSRKTDVMRITQTLPDGTKNPDNYIDLDRPYQVDFVKVDILSAQPNETQTWTDAFDTAGFTTMNASNRNTKTRFNLDRTLT